MRLYLVTKQELTEPQALHLIGRLAAPEHANDSGPCRVWSTYQSALYAFIHKETGVPIAIAEASGRPIAVPGWWIDSKFRGMGYGNELADLLAAKLKSEGVIGIGRIPIDTYNGNYNEQSSRLVKKITACFKTRAG